MAKEDFHFGTVARGVFIALLWFSFVISWHYPEWLFRYLLFLAFLGVGLKPLIVALRLDVFFDSVQDFITRRMSQKRLEERRKRVDRDLRDQKFRRMRKQDPRLPKNW